MVLAVFTILLGFFLPIARQFHTGSLLVAESGALATDLRRAQAAAIAGANDSSHGVHVDGAPTDRWVVFRGSTYVAGAPENEIHELPASLDVVSVVLAGGGQDVLFAERRGTTTQAGSITLQAPNGETRTISVNAQGTTDVQ